MFSAPSPEYYHQEHPEFGIQSTAPPQKKFRSGNSTFTEVTITSQWESHQNTHCNQLENSKPGIQTLEARIKSLSDQRALLEKRISILENKFSQIRETKYFHESIPPLFPNSDLPLSVQYPAVAFQPFRLVPRSNGQDFNLEFINTMSCEYLDEMGFLRKYDDGIENANIEKSPCPRSTRIKRKAESLQPQNIVPTPITLTPSSIRPKTQVEVLEPQKRLANAMAVSKNALTAETLLRKQQIAESLKYAKLALAIDPNFLLALRCKAEALRCLRRFDKSLKTANQILAFVPEDAIAINCIFQAMRSADAFQTGDY